MQEPLSFSFAHTHIIEMVKFIPVDCSEGTQGIEHHQSQKLAPGRYPRLNVRNIERLEKKSVLISFKMMKKPEEINPTELNLVLPWQAIPKAEPEELPLLHFQEFPDFKTVF